MGLDVNTWFSVEFSEIRCQFDRTVSLIFILLSLYLSGITSGLVSFWDFDDRMVCLFSNRIEFI